MAKAAPITLAEVLEKLNEKLDEAADFLEELEEVKKDCRHFTHRVSAFLSATGSVIMWRVGSILGVELPEALQYLTTSR